MARYEHLPIYKAALDMTVHFEGLVAGFWRYNKYTLDGNWGIGVRFQLFRVSRCRKI